MMEELKLYMLLLGCKPDGRHTEQHDVLFTIGNSLKSVIPDMLAFWPEADGVIHLDSWREVTRVNKFEIKNYPKGRKNDRRERENFFPESRRI